VKVEHTLVINQPVAKVFAALTDFENEPRWQTGLLESRHTPAGPVGIGTKVTQIRKFFGRPVETIGEVVEYEMNQKMVSRSTPENPPPSFKTVYRVEPIDDHTRLFYSIELKGQGFFKLIQPFIKRSITKDVITRFNTLKSLLEANG